MELVLSSSFHRFLERSESRIAQFIVRAYGYQYHFGRLEWYKRMITTDQINYLTLRSDGTISYLPKGKEHKHNEEGQWSRDGRQNGAPSRVIRKLLTKQAQKLFKDSEFEAFANSYKASCGEDGDRVFVLKPNTEIPYVYCMSRERGGGTLDDSCMNGDEEYLEIYTHVPGLKILCLINKEDRLCGRALVWSLPDGETFMDRIYVAQDHYYDLFLDYAKKNNWWRKVRYKSQSDKDHWAKNGIDYEYKKYTIKCPTEFNCYPYIDTFSYGSDGWLANHTNKCYEYEYCNTDGTREGDSQFYCEISGRNYHEEDMRYIERGRYNGYYIHCDYAVYCETDQYYYYENDDLVVEVDNSWYRRDDNDIVCVDGDWYMTDDEDIVDIDGEYYRKDSDEVVWAEYHGEYLLDSDCVFSEHHDSYIKSDEAYEVNGAYFHEDVVNKVA